MRILWILLGVFCALVLLFCWCLCKMSAISDERIKRMEKR